MRYRALKIGLCVATLLATPAVAQAPPDGIAERYRLAVIACDAVITGASVDAAADAAGLNLTAPSRAADTPLGANPATGVVAFFGADAQIRYARVVEAGAFVAFIVAADSSKCEVLGVARADLSDAGARGLADGARGWLQPEPGQQEMRRANGDRVAIQQTVDASGTQIVDARFVRGQR